MSWPFFSSSLLCRSRPLHEYMSRPAIDVNIMQYYRCQQITSSTISYPKFCFQAEDSTTTRSTPKPGDLTTDFICHHPTSQCMETCMMHPTWWLIINNISINSIISISTFYEETNEHLIPFEKRKQNTNINSFGNSQTDLFFSILENTHTINLMK